MKDVTLNNGTTMTDPEFIEKFGLGDAPTDFVATKDDLGSLANGIVNDLLAAEFYIKICVGRMDILRRDYILNRLIRLVDYLPELDEMVRERLRLGREKNGADYEKYVAEGEAHAKAASAGKGR